MQAAAPELTDFNDGSICDTEAGVFSLGGIELTRTILLEFQKCFFSTADGPEVTGTTQDDLQTLAVDRFGQAFARPGAIAAIDTVTFSRPNNAEGAVVIVAGSIVKTKPDANGNIQQYRTQSTVTLTNNGGSADLSVSVSVVAIIPGAAGDAVAGTITVIETSLPDLTITVTNIGNATGQNAQDDATYRQTILNLIQSLSKATLLAVQSTALTVPGVVTATPAVTVLTAINYNPVTHATVGNYFYIPQAVLYVADSTGTASQALLTAVALALQPIEAAGVYIQVLAATAQIVNWTAMLVLNPLGPNYATLSSNTSIITTAMFNYLSNLPVGTNFVRLTAQNAILAIYGPAGTNDLVSITTTIPTGDVAAPTASTKLVPGITATV